MRAQDYGEITVYLISGSVFLLLFAMGHCCMEKRLRVQQWTMYVLIGMLAFCAGVVDILSRVYDHWNRRTTSILIEDGGEMLVVSLMVVFVVMVYRYTMLNAAVQRSMPSTAHQPESTSQYPVAR